MAVWLAGGLAVGCDAEAVLLAGGMVLRVENIDGRTVGMASGARAAFLYSANGRVGMFVIQTVGAWRHYTKRWV